MTAFLILLGVLALAVTLTVIWVLEQRAQVRRQSARRRAAHARRIAAREAARR